MRGAELQGHVEYLDDERLELVNVHVDQHARVRLVEFADVGELLQDARQHRLAGVAQARVHVEQVRVLLLRARDDRARLHAGAVRRQHHHDDHQHEDDVVALRRLQEAAREPRVLREERDALVVAELEAGGGDGVRGAGARHRPRVALHIKHLGGAEDEHLDDAALQQRDLVVLPQPAEHAQLLRHLDEAPHRALSHVEELRARRAVQRLLLHRTVERQLEGALQLRDLLLHRLREAVEGGRVDQRPDHVRLLRRGRRLQGVRRRRRRRRRRTAVRHAVVRRRLTRTALTTHTVLLDLGTPLLLLLVVWQTKHPITQSFTAANTHAPPACTTDMEMSLCGNFSVFHNCFYGSLHMTNLHTVVPVSLVVWPPESCTICYFCNKVILQLISCFCNIK